MKVVIADDTLKSQMQAYLTLRTRHACEIAEDRETVIKLVHDYRPDIVLLALGFDSKNGNNGGWEHLVEELRRTAPSPILIGISDGGDVELEERAKEIGLHNIIHRPIRRQKLLEMIVSGNTEKKTKGRSSKQ